eukprot:5201029-Pleurochrysis_carterae.AAC.1
MKPCEDSVVGVDGRPQRCIVIGDLPITASDKAGNNVDLTLNDVGCVPSFADSLLSVNALWEASASECRFANENAIFTSPTAKGDRLVLPFRRTGGAFRMARSDPPPRCLE